MSVFLNNLDDFIAPSQACVNPLVLNKPKATAAASDTTNTSSSATAKIVLQTDFSVSEFDGLVGSKRQILPHSQAPDLIKTKMGTQNQKVASVSLNDCLACRFVLLLLSLLLPLFSTYVGFVLSFSFLSALFSDSAHYSSFYRLLSTACLVSGCVTSAETVLIQEQSYEKLLARLLSLPSAITAPPSLTRPTTNDNNNDNDHGNDNHEGNEDDDRILLAMTWRSMTVAAGRRLTD